MPQVIVSTTTSLDGYLDDTSHRRLILSSPEDTRELHQLRARVGAILIGAETLRADNPRLNTRYAELKPDVPPAKIVVTNTGNIDCTSRFFSEGLGRKIVFCGPDTPSESLTRLANVATVVPSTQTLTANAILAYLAAAGITQLLVEGGAIIQELFFAEDCVDILRLGHAPLLLGKHGRARFLSRGVLFPSTLTTLSTQKLGSTAVTWYQVKSDYEFLRRAARLGGAIILSKFGEEVRGISEKLSPTHQATEVALIKAQQLGIDTQEATVFTSVELTDASVSLLLKCGVGRIVAPKQEEQAELGVRVMARLAGAGITVLYCDLSTPTPVF